jgi:hypothetical protein
MKAIVMMGWVLKPKNTLLEADVAGRVEAAGGNIKLFRPSG